MEAIAKLILRETNIEVNEKAIVKLPNEDRPHLKNCDIYATRYSEYVIIAYVYDDGTSIVCVL